MHVLRVLETVAVRGRAFVLVRMVCGALQGFWLLEMDADMLIDSHDRISEQFGRFLMWVFIVAIGLGGFMLALAWRAGSVALGVIGGTTLVFGVLCYAARIAVRRGAEVAAAAAVCCGYLVAPVIYVAVLPTILPTAIFFLLAAASLPMLFRSYRLIRNVHVLTIVMAVVIALVSIQPPLLPLLPGTLNPVLRLMSLPVCTALMALLFGFIWRTVSDSLERFEQAHHELSMLKVHLEDQVAERTAALTRSLVEIEAQTSEQARLLAENAQQRQVIRDVSIPVLPIAAHTLVMPLVGVLDADRLCLLQMQAMTAITRTAAHWLVLDITGVPVVDSPVALGLLTTVKAARLLGAEVVLVGIRPEVAQTMIALDFTWAHVRTMSTLQSALALTVDGRVA